MRSSLAGSLICNSWSKFFEVSEPFTFKAGQYVFVNLPKLNYPDDRGPRRQFSIVNSPNQKGIIVVTTRLSDSGFKKTLNELPIGTEVELGPVAGVIVGVTEPDGVDSPRTRSPLFSTINCRERLTGLLLLSTP